MNYFHFTGIHILRILVRSLPTYNFACSTSGAQSPSATPGDRLLGWRKSLGNSLVLEGAGIGGAVGRMTGNGKNCPQAAGQGQAESQVTASDVVGFIDFGGMVETCFVREESGS